MVDFRTLGTLAVAAFLASASPANAVSTHDPVISEARVNEARTQLVVIGSDFPTTGERLFLGIGAAPLVVTLATPTRIEALLPAGIEPGTYLLSLTSAQGNGNGQHGDEFWVTLGAVGPTGAQGAAGPQGTQGTTGQTGPAGPAGAMGPQGIQGFQGPVGPVGAQGSAGVPGATGAQGPSGNVGPQGPAGPQGSPGPTGAAGPQGPAGTGATPTSFVVSARVYHVAGPYLMLAYPVAECPAGSVITGGYTNSYGAWQLFSGYMAANAWHQNAEATIIMAPEHYVEANAICLRIG